MSRFLPGERILLTIWVGGMWAIGYMVAPALFANLEDRSLAGTLAGVMFEIIAYVGLACGSLLLMFNQLRRSQRRLNWRAVVLFAMLVLVGAGQFVLAPMIAEVRIAGASDSSSFAQLHGLASLVFSMTSLLGLLLVVWPDTGATAD